jgi:hypothetical protein
MSRKTVLCASLLALLIFISACTPTSPTPGGADPGALETEVAAQLTRAAGQAPTRTLTPEPSRTPENTPLPTLTPSVTPTPEPSPTPTPNTGLVRGKICAPPEGKVELILFFQQAQADAGEEPQITELNAGAGQTTYEISLEPGSYTLYAWLADFSRGGLYSAAVPCGLGSSCKDHSLLKFEARVGEELAGIDLCDWRAGPFSVPYPPNRSEEELTGDISGSIQHPGTPPSLTVVVTNVTTRNWYYVITNPGWTRFTFENLPPGSYYAVAYTPDNTAGAYANASHSLITFKVEAGKTVPISINDWTAPAGTFPASPLK